MRILHPRCGLRICMDPGFGWGDDEGEPTLMNGPPRLIPLVLMLVLVLALIWYLY